MDLTDQPSNGDIAWVYDVEADSPLGALVSNVNAEGTDLTVFAGTPQEQLVCRDEHGVWRTMGTGFMVVFEQNPAVPRTVIPAFKSAAVGDYTVRIVNGNPEVFGITEVYDNGSSADVEPFFDFSPSYGNVTTIELDNERYVWMDGTPAYITDGEESQLLWAATRATAVYQLVREKFFHYQNQASTAGSVSGQTTVRAVADEMAVLLFLLETGLRPGTPDVGDRWVNYVAALHQEYLDRQQG